MNPIMAGVFLMVGGLCLIASRQWAVGLAGVAIAFAGAFLISNEAAIVLALILLPVLGATVWINLALERKHTEKATSEGDG